MAKGGIKGKPGGSGGGDGPLYLSGNKKANTLTGGDFDDWINGKAGDDTLYGGDGDDTLLGADGNDILYGEGGNDELHGGRGDDELYGGANDDMLQGGAGEDMFDGGGGYDIAAFVEIARGAEIPGTYQFVGLTFTTTASDPTGSTYSVHNPDTGETETVINVEEIWGSNYNDSMSGGTGNDYFVGARGNDILIGDAGDDTLYGSLDDDEIDAGEGSGSGSDLLIFLRYTSDYDGDGTPEDIFGDGHDTVYNFDLVNDSILFLNDETDAAGQPDPVFDVLSDLVVDGSGFARIDYAEDSSILLDGITVADVQTADAARLASGDPLFSYEYVDV